MKKLLTISLISLSLTIVACGSKKVVESTYDNGNPNVVHYYKKVKGEKVLAREEIFYEKGSKKMAGAFTENQRDGVWKAWYEDGTLWSEGVYKNGKRNGPGTTYHPNGKKYIEGNYKDDVQVGIWKIWDENGNLEKEVNYDSIPALK